MAKKDKFNSTQVDDIFSQLIKEQNQLSPGAAVSGTEMFSAVDMWIPTGSSIFDTIISNDLVGGWPAGRIVEVFGQESIGKSTLAFAAMASVQRLGGIPIYFDVEQAGSEDMMRACGVDLRRLIVSGLTSVEEIFAAMEQNLQTIINNKTYAGKPVFICLDSLAQMTTDAEIEADYENNMNINTLKAKQIGKAYRKITPYLRKANACLMVINQLRDRPGVMFGDPTTTPGGNATKFAATIRIKLLGKKPVEVPDPTIEAEWAKLQQEYSDKLDQWKENGKLGVKPEKPIKPKGDAIIIGYDVVARTVKNKVGPPQREAEFRIIFSQGIIEEPAWFDYAIKFNIIRQIDKQNWAFVDQTWYADYFKAYEWVEILADAELHEKVHKLILSKLVKNDVVFGTEDEVNPELEPESNE